MNFKSMKTCLQLRTYFNNFNNENISCLEIAPYHNPVLKNSKTFDVYSKNKLIELCQKDYNINSCDKIKDVDFVDEKGDLSSIKNETFDLILSSHCLEHTVDLITHLEQVLSLLKNQGHYICFVPHRLYCFDHYKQPKSAADVLEAYYTKRKLPTLKTFLETAIYTAHNDPTSHWKGIHGNWNSFDKKSIENLVEHYEKITKEEQYTSLHNWQFTLQEFISVFSILKQLEFFNNFNIVYTIDVNKDSHEFCIIFQKN